MKYYLIAGEASGDLHASHLMAELKRQDSQAKFRYYGGDLMQEQGGQLVQHYRQLAYMGFIPVLMHLRTILRGMKRCRQDILNWQPDVLILVDYPGFNLRVARHIRRHSRIPIYYYIAPKIWAWKEHRIHAIRRDVNQIFSILPFEVDYFEKKHHYPVHYVGNPSVDEVDAFLRRDPKNEESFRHDTGLDSRPLIALLAGSRKQEIQNNLGRMLEAASIYTQDYQLVIAAAPGIPDDYYQQWTGIIPATIVRNQTFRLLQHSTAALVTSGTATLETALFGIPQVVCYYMRAGRLASLGKKLFLRVPYISLVNLIASRLVVPELVAEQMNVDNIREHLAVILPGGRARAAQMAGYAHMQSLLGEAGAPQRAAQLMINLLSTETH